MNNRKVCKWFSGCPMKYFYDNGYISRVWIVDYCYRDGEGCRRKKLQEEGVAHPDNMMPNGNINKDLCHPAIDNKNK